MLHSQEPIWANYNDLSETLLITPILIAIALYRHLMLALVLARYQEYPRWYYHVKHVKSELKTPSLL